MTFADTQARLVELSSVIARVESELSALALRSEEAQDAVSHALRPVPLADRDLVALQSLDAITQHLAGLSSFMRHLAPQIAGSCRVDPHAASAAIAVESLARRLSPSGEGTETAGDGEEDWFLGDGPAANAA